MLNMSFIVKNNCSIKLTRYVNKLGLYRNKLRVNKKNKKLKKTFKQVLQQIFKVLFSFSFVS